MKKEKHLKKIISIMVIGAFLFQINICLNAQSEEEIVKQFQKAKSRYKSGQYVNAKTRIERIINIIIGRNIGRSDILGGCYLLLGAIYEKENKEVLAEENYRKAKETYGIMLVEGVDLDPLPLYRKIVKGEIPPTQGIIAEEGKKKKKRFPWLLVVGGTIVVGTLLYFLVLKPKKKNLGVELGEGVQGTPGSGSYQYKKGEVVPYSYELLPGYSQLQVYLDNQPTEPSGQVTMNRDHQLTASAAANVVEIIPDTNQLDIPEGDTASFNIKLSNQPRSDVNVTVSHIGGDSDIEVVPGGESITFTPSNWNTWKTVTLQAAEDPDALNGEATIHISASDTGITPKDITATEIDNDTLRFITDTNNVSINEGSTVTFKVKLSAAPPANITASVSRSGGDSDITVKSGSTLRFNANNWNRNQDVVLQAAQDPDVENGTAIIRIRADGVADKEITAVEIDDDGLGFIIKTDTDPIEIEEGGTADFQVKLSAKPSANITAEVARLSGDTDITVQSGSALNFTPDNWDRDQTVTLAAAQDNDTQQGTAVIRVSAPGSGLANRDIDAKEIDDDALQFETDVNEVTIDENGTATFQVRLSAQPDSDITANVSHISGDSDISVQSGSTLDFNSGNWETYQTVTLQAAQDEDEENGEAQIGISSSGIPTKRITARENDNYRGQPPEVSISAPENEETVSNDVTIRAIANDDFGIKKVEFYIDDEYKDHVTSYPYRYVWSTRDVSTSPHQIKVIAYDFIDQTAEDEITVTVGDDPPTVSITEPTTTPLSGTVTIQVHAEDYKAVQSVQIYIDDAPLFTWDQGPQAEVDFNFNLDTTAYSNGSHTLKAVAVDTAAQESEPAEIKIIIENL